MIDLPIVLDHDNFMRTVNHVVDNGLRLKYVFHPERRIFGIGEEKINHSSIATVSRLDPSDRRIIGGKFWTENIEGFRNYFLVFHTLSGSYGNIYPESVKQFFEEHLENGGREFRYLGPDKDSMPPLYRFFVVPPQIANRHTLPEFIRFAYEKEHPSFLFAYHNPSENLSIGSSYLYHETLARKALAPLGIDILMKDDIAGGVFNFENLGDGVFDISVRSGSGHFWTKDPLPVRTKMISILSELGYEAAEGAVNANDNTARIVVYKR